MISRQVLESLVEKGIQAPTGDNLQPWKFRLREEAVDLYMDGTRISDVFDAGYRTAYISIGAVIENIALAASDEGCSIVVHPFPQGESIDRPVATLTLEPSKEPADPLHRQIEARVTNRKFYDHKPVPEETVNRLVQMGTIPGRSRLLFVGPGKTKNELARLIGAVDQIRFEVEKLHGEFFKTMRFKREEAERAKDGIDLRSLELDLPQRLFFRFISKWERMRWLNRLGMTVSFNLYAQLQVRSSPLVGLLTTENNSPLDYLEGGRLMERVFLKIAEGGLVVQPMMGIPVFIINLQVNGGRFFSPAQRAELLRIKERFFRLFDLNDRAGLIMLFRMGYAPPPTCRSLRRPLADFLMEEG